MNNQSAPLTTRQGVRNLNGPRMDGRNHNGRASASCAHYKSPDMPTYPQERVMPVTTEYGTVERVVRCHHCSICGELRFTELED